MIGLAAFVDRCELDSGRALAKKLNVVACDGGAGDEPCFFPQCLAHGCEGACPGCESAPSMCTCSPDHAGEP